MQKLIKEMDLVRGDKSPLISIITSFYNAEKYAVKSISSVLNQSYKNLELIIVDDCSTDSTRKIIQQFAESDKRVKPIYLDRKINDKLPLIANLNLAWDNALGEYIARIDHDDFWAVEKLEKQIKYLEENSNVYLLGTSAELISEDGKVQGYHLPPTDIIKATKELQNRNIIYNSTSVFRNDPRYRYRLPFAEDYDLWLQILKDGNQVANLSDVLTQYTLVNKSYSRSNPLKPWCGAIIAKRIFKGEAEFTVEAPYSLYSNFVKMSVNIIDILDLCRVVLAVFAKDLPSILSSRIFPPKKRFN
jgi:glycosyltransferase involved in cell wall biosynthesis